MKNYIMRTAEITDIEEAIKEWKVQNISRCEMQFSCGGDSMNDTSFTFYNKDENEIKNELLWDFFNDEVYKNVEFYECSDGHYIGESGTVFIELSPDENEPEFTYNKEAEGEWSETFTEVGYMPITQAEQTILRDKIHSIVGGEDGEALNYKADCILSDDEDEVLTELVDKIRDFAVEYQFKEFEGEPDNWFSYTTDIEELSEREFDDAVITIKDNELAISISRQFIVYKSE
jgi:hypothetical protein